MIGGNWPCTCKRKNVLLEKSKSMNFTYFLLEHSAERCISRSFLFSSPLSLETCNPPRDTHQWKIPDSMMIHWNQGDWKRYNGLETYYLYKICVLSTECVLIDITVTISIAVGTGCNFPHGGVGTKSHHIKTYHWLTIS